MAPLVRACIKDVLIQWFVVKRGRQDRQVGKVRSFCPKLLHDVSIINAFPTCSHRLRLNDRLFVGYVLRYLYQFLHHVSPYILSNGANIGSGGPGFLFVNYWYSYTQLITRELFINLRFNIIIMSIVALIRCEYAYGYGCKRDCRSSKYCTTNAKYRNGGQPALI